MKKFIFVTLALLAVTCFANNATAQVKYQGEVNMSVGGAFMGNNYDYSALSAHIETVHGVRVKSFFGGIGVGIHEYINFGDNDTYYDAMLPIFANAKYYFMDQRVSPYVGADVGYAFGLTDGCPDGFYVSPTIGVNFRLGAKLGLHVGVSYQGQSWGKNYLYGDTMFLHGVAAKVGFTW